AVCGAGTVARTSISDLARALPRATDVTLIPTQGVGPFMAGNVHHLAAPAGPSPVAAASLRASGTLWAAEDLDQVVAAAHMLLTELVPGAQVRRCACGDAERLGTPPDHREQVPLSDCEMLVLTANGPSEAGAVLPSAAGADIATMFGALHQIVGTLMYAQNFFVALYDASRDSVRFPYYADSADPTIPDPHNDMSMGEIERGPTWYVIRDGKPLMGSLDALKLQVSGAFHSSGTDCVDWLGVPLLRGSVVVGCVVVQSYDDAHHYDEQDKALLIYVAQHIQTALERRLAHAELEHRVGERTEALRDANRVLQQQVLERQRGERLQAALFRIAELATTTDSIDNFYAAVHRVVGGLLYARNFYIALLSEDGGELTFPY